MNDELFQKIMFTDSDDTKFQGKLAKGIANQTLASSLHKDILVQEVLQFSVSN